MKRKIMSLETSKSCLAVAAIALFSLAGLSPTSAQTTFTTGPGSAVGTVENFADFDTGGTFVFTDAYSEGGLHFTAPNGVVSPNFFSSATDHTYYTNGGGYSYTTVAKSDSSLFHALEFQVDNGFSLPTTFLHYEIFSGGRFQTAGSVDAAFGSTIGFLSPSGFDLLKIGAYRNDAEAQVASDTSFQALVIDDVSAGQPFATAVPEPGSITLLLGMGVTGAGFVARRRKTRA